ncbi:hypothetical protein BCY88_23915 [Paraburkholderia fungorum]|uniref:Uncharacterized protein n=1 Tax=Paraburkholderia fungorum TaxID=134537 RepID=A0A3R7E7U9_9BURK|nr:hypothetical protein BCY88_23915 [Paraburkholderia fungorum]
MRQSGDAEEAAAARDAQPIRQKRGKRRWAGRDAPGRDTARCAHWGGATMRLARLHALARGFDQPAQPTPPVQRPAQRIAARFSVQTDFSRC